MWTPFVQLLQEHGFTIAMGGKHYDIRHEKLAPGQKAVTSVTPSDSQRWHLNSARQIRNTSVSTCATLTRAIAYAGIRARAPEEASRS